jgi:hypothetical protein
VEGVYSTSSSNTCLLLAFGILSYAPLQRLFKAACIEHMQLSHMFCFSGFKTDAPKPKSGRCLNWKHYRTWAISEGLLNVKKLLELAFFFK